MVKLSKEFNTIQEAVDFMNTLKDVFSSFIIPYTFTYDDREDEKLYIVTHYFVVYFEEETGE